ncbi:hypothetical protein EC957_005895 [Mortierella hygrophila]|uniref:Uncharacterized protein n=1 Tax=Mortierella hygrophila TaxID=979708 RepID=A0A9P6FDA1_9FUNG|nr:hypothetical protein EC957_005895 [Mortierella hygrophila]
MPGADLVFHSTVFEQDGLENFLDFVPQLKVLKLVSLRHRRNSNEGYSGPRPLRHIQSPTMDLDFIHFSKQEWHSWPRNISPSFLKQLDVHTDRLTTLELYYAPRGLDLSSYLNTAALTIHDVLCMSDKVVHLKTLRTVVRLEDMDIHR